MRPTARPRHRSATSRRGAALAVVVAGLVALPGVTAARDDGPVLPDRPDGEAARVEAAAEPDGERPPASGRLGDEVAVSRHIDDPDGEVGQRWRARARNLAQVPFAALDLRLDPAIGEVTTDRVRDRFDEDEQVVVVGVVEEHVLDRHDLDGPARFRHTLTFRRDEGDWLLVEDRDGRALGRPEPGFLWDLVEVSAVRSGPVLALHGPDAAGVEDLVAETAAAMARLPDRWPADWSQRTTLVVPTDREQLRHVLGGGLDLDDFLAFTSATPHRAPGTQELTGTRLVVNPERFPSAPDARERVLLHELVHVATRPLASDRMPMWLEEGVAQALGEQGPSTGHTQQLDAAGPSGRRLPTDAEFSALGRETTFLSYQRAYSFVAHLVDRADREAVVDFYRAVGAGAARPGTLEHRLDEAARRELGADLATLVEEWRASG